MPFTQVNTQNPVGPYPVIPVAPTSLDIAFTAVDAVNGNYFTADNNPVTVRPEGTYGGDILLIDNPTGGALTITFTSQPDAQGRSGDITTYSIGAGVTSAFKYSNLVGWADGTGKVFFTGAAGLLVAVLER
jgi:hypothetical protein